MNLFFLTCLVWLVTREHAPLMVLNLIPRNNFGGLIYMDLISGQRELTILICWAWAAYRVFSLPFATSVTMFCRVHSRYVFHWIKMEKVYWIMILRDFKRLFYHEKVLWYSIKTLFNLKKVLCYSIKILWHLKKVLWYSIKTLNHLKKV